MAYDSCDVTPGSELALKLQQIDKVAMAVFVSELVAKVIAYGLGQSHHSQIIMYAVVWGHVMDLAGGAFFGYSQS